MMHSCVCCRYDSSWLQREVAQYFPGEESYLGMSREDLCTTIFDVLTEANSDEQQQNDVSIVNRLHYLVPIRLSSVNFIWFPVDCDSYINMFIL
jgi:hypothetical protein